MIKYAISLSFAVLILSSCNGENSAVKDLPVPTNENDKLSYIIGFGLGSQMGFDSINPNYDYLLLGIQKGLIKDTSFINQAEMDMALMNWRDAKAAKKRYDDSLTMAMNVTENKKFFEENLKKSGVKATASGMQYEVLKEGSGSSPVDDDLVTFHVVGKLLNGKEFDNTYTRGQPYTMPVNSSLKGWTEALKMMKPGSKYRVYLPPELGLGDRGGPDIPAGSLLIFEMELVSIDGKAPQIQQQQMR